MTIPADDDAPTWPTGTVEALLHTELVTAPTKAALTARLARASTPPLFLSEAQCAILRAACARMIVQPDPARQVDIAGLIDARLARGDGDGWRYDLLPPDGEAYRRGLDGLDRAASQLCNTAFDALDPGSQDWLLGLCQAGEVGGDALDGLAGERWFEELLAEATELFYAHPWSQEAIGYVGMADARGWTAIGLDQLEPREPAAAPDPKEGRRAAV